MRRGRGRGDVFVGVGDAQATEGLREAQVAIHDGAGRWAARAGDGQTVETGSEGTGSGTGTGAAGGTSGGLQTVAMQRLRSGIRSPGARAEGNYLGRRRARAEKRGRAVRRPAEETRITLSRHADDYRSTSTPPPPVVVSRALEPSSPSRRVPCRIVSYLQVPCKSSFGAVPGSCDAPCMDATVPCCAEFNMYMHRPPITPCCASLSEADTHPTG